MPFIKQIVIHGFKSYKDQTVIEPFSPKHNVIVGRNGSGKSNFFWAIRFVLSDAYVSMNREERQALLHEGSGHATLSAYVEVIFDNGDNRFPTGKEEVVLRRTIGLKKDEYSLDRKTVTKTDVLNLLESAGFSRSNPYYIVTALTNAKDAERLALLKEVAGTRVYEQRRVESLKIIDETEMKRQKIQELLSYIEERLAELEEEKEELRQFQEADKERRCIEYAIYSREQNELVESLEELEEARRAQVEGTNSRLNDYEEREHTILETERELADLKKKLELLLSEKETLADEKEEQLKAKAHLELLLGDFEGSRAENSNIKKALARELEVLEQSIKEKADELEEITPDYERLVARETELKQRIDECEVERNALNSKQGRNAKFRNKSERDRYLNQEIRDSQQLIENQQSQLEEVKEELQSLLQEKERLIHEISEKKEMLEEKKREFEEGMEQERRVKGERGLLDEKKKNLWREDAKLTGTIASLRAELQTAERALAATMDRNTSAGLSAVDRIVARLRLQDKVYGPVYKLMQVDERYQTAVEVVGGGSLFHVVVDSDTTVTQLLEQMNKEKQQGRVTFMPLNRLNPQPAQGMEQTNDAVPMLRKIRYDPAYEKAFVQIFGKAIICPTLEVASAYARNKGFTAVTLDGDRADKKGALTGGYHDTKRSRLETARSISNLSTQLAKHTTRHTEIKHEIAQVEGEITRARDQATRIEAVKQGYSKVKESIKADLAIMQKNLTRLEETIEAREGMVQSLEATLAKLQAQVQGYSVELREAFVKKLSSQEEQKLTQVRAELQQTMKEFAKVQEQRAQLQEKKSMLEIELSTNLKRRREETMEKLENLAAQQMGSGQEDKAELSSVEEALEEINNSLVNLEGEVEETSAAIAEVTQTLDTLKATQAQDEIKLQQQARSVEKYLSKKALLLRKRDECSKNIRDLGVLPEEAFDKYTGPGDADSGKLVKRLLAVNEELKAFSHVNKKAYEQFSSFTQQKESLTKRKEELDSSAQAIEDLIQVLDQRKDEAIQRTFKQAAKNFAGVWAKLVPQGQGQLIMVRRSSDGEDEETHGVESYTGVAIKVSFNKTDGGLRMNQLSGGQKSLVALALIFAIQQCDPAPFYLFDEIDAALDAQYRTAVANMIMEMSNEAQFITTTFRPELLVHADKFYGVTFVDKVSRINVISQQDAREFVNLEQAV